MSQILRTTLYFEAAKFFIHGLIVVARRASLTALYEGAEVATLMTDLKQRVDALEAALGKLAADLAELKGGSTKPIPSASIATRDLVLHHMRQAIEAAGGEARLSTRDVASKTGLHQTHVAAIIRALIRDGDLQASGRRNRRYRNAREPSRSNPGPS